MENNIRQQLEEMIKTWGPELVLQNAYALLGGTGKEVAPGIEIKPSQKLLETLVGMATISDNLANNLHAITAGAANAVGELIKEAERAGHNVVEHSKQARSIPAEHWRILAPQLIERTLEQLDSTVSDILAAGEKREAAQKERGPLLQRKAQLETDIKLTESDALAEVQGTGKEAFVMVGGQKLFLPNEDARNAYRRTLTKPQRTELSGIEGQLAAAEAEAARYKIPFDTAVEAATSVRAKAAVQAALLNYLAGGR